MKCQFRFIKPPAEVRRVHPDNLALVPGNLLPALKRYQALAHDVPAGEFLIVLPDQDSKQRATVAVVAQLLKQAGHQVRILREDQLVPPPTTPVQPLPYTVSRVGREGARSLRAMRKCPAR